MRRYLVLSAVWLAALAVSAEEPASVPAEAVTLPAVPLDKQLSLTYTVPDSGAIAKGISVDLIDLDRLEAALQARNEGRILRMSLDQAIAFALAQNDDILIASFGPQKAEADQLAARGEFDPVLQSKAMYLNSSTSASQQIYAFGGISQIKAFQTSVQAGIAGKLQYGTQYGVSFDSTKEESTFSNFIEEFQAGLTFTLTQPLLRGFGKDANLVRIKAAQTSQALSQAQLEAVVFKAVGDTIKAYWDLAGAAEALKVKREALENAQRLLSINEKRRGFGTAADLDVLQAKAGVAMRQSDMVTALSQVENAGDLLKSVMGLKEEGAFSKAQIAAVDRPSVGEIAPLDPAQSEAELQAALENARQRRPEMRMAELQIESAQLEEDRARHDMLPQFDVTGSYMQGGRDHQLRETLYGIRDKQDTSFSYGVQGAIPLGNRAARGAYQRAHLSRREFEQRKTQARQTVEMNVHLAHRAVETNQILVESTRQACRLQEANVAAEEKRLQLGVSTSYQVLKIQEDLTAARTQQVQAEVALEKARIDLLAAEGRLLEERGIAFEAPEAESAPGFLESVRPRWE